MQKFPLRMKDNDLLVTELYKDPSNDEITSISIYLTPKTTSEYLYIKHLTLIKKKNFHFINQSMHAAPT